MYAISYNAQLQGTTIIRCPESPHVQARVEAVVFDSETRPEVQSVLTELTDVPGVNTLGELRLEEFSTTKAILERLKALLYAEKIGLTSSKMAALPTVGK